MSMMKYLAILKFSKQNNESNRNNFYEEYSTSRVICLCCYKKQKNSLFYENRVAIVKSKSVEEYLQKKLDDNVSSPMDCIPLIEK